MRKNRKNSKKATKNSTNAISNYEVEFFRKFSRIHDDFEKMNIEFTKTYTQLSIFNAELNNIQCDIDGHTASKTIDETAQRNIFMKASHLLFSRILGRDDF